MSRATRILFCLLLVGVIAAAGMALVAGPGDKGGKFIACPSPPCLAPCVLGEEPTVLCKSRGGSPTRTTFACCCCGGGGNKYRPL